MVLTLDQILQQAVAPDASKNTRYTYRSLLQKLGGPNADYNKVFRGGAKPLIAKMKQAFDNQATLATAMGAVSRVIRHYDQGKKFGWKPADFALLSSALQDTSRLVKTARLQRTGRGDIPEELSWEKLLEYEEDLREKDPATMQHLTIALFTLIPPRRAWDYENMIYVRDASEAKGPEDNLCVIPADPRKPVQLIFTNYKTSDSYGKQTIVLSKTKGHLADVCPDIQVLGDVLRLVRQRYPGRKRVLPPKALQKAIHEGFGVTAGVQAVRRLWATWLWDNQSRFSAYQMQNLTDAAAHSSEESRNYRIVTPMPAKQVETEGQALREALALLKKVLEKES